MEAESDDEERTVIHEVRKKCVGMTAERRGESVTEKRDAME